MNAKNRSMVGPNDCFGVIPACQQAGEQAGMVEKGPLAGRLLIPQHALTLALRLYGYLTIVYLSASTQERIMARLEQLQSMLADSPQDGFLLFALAKEHEKAGDDDNALHYYKSLELIDPTYVGLYYHLAKLYERRNEIETAFHSYTTGMKVAKEAGDDHAYRELAGARLEIGDEDDF